MMKQKSKEEKIREDLILTPILVCVFPTPRKSVTLAGCPTIWLNADTIYMEIASDPTD